MTLENWRKWTSGGLFEQWYGQETFAPDFIIGHGGISLALVRGATTLAAQNVFLAPGATTSQAQVNAGETGRGAVEQLLIVGKPALDIKEGDRFSYQSSPIGRLNYRVVRVERSFPHMIQAFAEVTS